MIREHFGLNRVPFQKDVDLGDLHRSEGFDELLARLHYTVQNRCLALVTGEVGSGKSTALRAFSDQLDRTTYHFVYIADSSLTPRAFYERVLSAMGLEPIHFMVRLKERFKAGVLDLADNGRHPVIAIDEGHDLEGRMLKELTFLTNFHFDSKPLVTIILAGQPLLRATLSLRVHEPLAQRIGVRYHLGHMTPEETRTYILHHLRTAGAKTTLFTDSVLERIHAHAKGVPRVTNNLALACMVDAASRKAEIVNDDNLEHVIQDLSS